MFNLLDDQTCLVFILAPEEVPKIRNDTSTRERLFKFLKKNSCQSWLFYLFIIELGHTDINFKYVVIHRVGPFLKEDKRKYVKHRHRGKESSESKAFVLPR